MVRHMDSWHSCFLLRKCPFVCSGLQYVRLIVDTLTKKDYIYLKKRETSTSMWLNSCLDFSSDCPLLCLSCSPYLPPPHLSGSTAVCVCHIPHLHTEVNVHHMLGHDVPNKLFCVMLIPTTSVSCQYCTLGGTYIQWQLGESCIHVLLLYSNTW